MLEVKNINKNYKTVNFTKTITTEALKNVNINFGKNGLTFILGKSGSGKSTLLNILGGLDTPTSGEIVFKGKSFKDFKSRDYDSYRNTSIGFVFQESNLIEKYNVFDNVSYPLKLQNKIIDENIVLDALDKVGLKDLAKKMVNELSPSQKQCVVIARALVKNPSIILADEPTGNLDSENSKMIFEILKNLSQERLVIVVSHDEESANLYGDRIIELQDGVVIRDTNPSVLSDDSTYSLKNNHLPFKEALRFSIKNLFGHKVKLVLSIILISFIFSFIGFTFMQIYLKDSSESQKMLETFDIKYLDVLKSGKRQYGYGYNNVYYSDSKTFTEDEYQELIKEVNIPIHKRYFFRDIILNRYFKYEENEDEIGYYYKKYENAMFFSELDEKDFNFKLIGRKPENYDEVVIIKPVADFLIKYGYTLYDENGKEIIYKPTSYEEIVNDQKELNFRHTKIKISGIIDDDLTEFETLTQMTPFDLRLSRDENILKSKEKYDSLYPVEFYALSGFSEFKMQESSDGDNFISLYVLTKDIDDYDEFFEKFPIVRRSRYISSSSLFDNLADSGSDMLYYSKLILIVSIPVSILIIFLLLNFVLSIRGNKKEIGLLRSLGTSKKDISKIYLIQGLLVLLISYVISLFLEFFYAIVENNLIFSVKYTLKGLEIYRINPVGLTSQSILIMLIFMVIVLLLSIFRVFRKISKVEPINAINNK